MIEIIICFVQKDSIPAMILAFNLQNYHFPKEYPNNISVHFPLTPVEKIEKQQIQFIEDIIIMPVASRHSAASKSFNETVSFFANRGNNRILPFIIDGIPKSITKADECLCPFLLLNQKDEYFIPNIQEDGLRNAIQQTVSTVGEIPLDALKKSREKRKRQRLILFLLLFVALTVYLFFDLYTFHKRTQYYESYSYSYGLPIGNNRILFPMFYKGKTYYSFESFSGTVAQVIRHGEKNSSICQDKISGIYDPKQVIVFTDYYDESLVDSIVYLDDAENIIAVANYSAHNICIDYSKRTDGIEPYYITNICGVEVSASRCILSYKENGAIDTAVYYENSSKCSPVWTLQFP